MKANETKTNQKKNKEKILRNVTPEEDEMVSANKSAQRIQVRATCG